MPQKKPFLLNFYHKPYTNATKSPCETVWANFCSVLIDQTLWRDSLVPAYGQKLYFKSADGVADSQSKTLDARMYRHCQTFLWKGKLVNTFLPTENHGFYRT